MKRRKSRREKDSRAKGRLRAKILAAKREREGGEEKEPLASQKKSSSSSTVLDPLRSHPPPPPPRGTPCGLLKGERVDEEEEDPARVGVEGECKKPFCFKRSSPVPFHPFARRRPAFFLLFVCGQCISGGNPWRRKGKGGPSFKAAARKKNGG